MPELWTPAKHLLNADVKSFPWLDFSHGVWLRYHLRLRSWVRKWQTSFLCSQQEIWAVPRYSETVEASASVQEETLLGVKEGFDWCSSSQTGRRKKESGKDVLTETKLTLLDGLLRRRTKENGDAAGGKSTANARAHQPIWLVPIPLCPALLGSHRWAHHSEFQGTSFLLLVIANMGLFPRSS